MSCHAKHVSTAATRLAQRSSGLDDAQVSSLFHLLKRQAAKAEAPHTSEYRAGLDRFAFRVRSAEDLDERTRNRLLARFQTAHTEPVDGPTWAASQEIEAAAHVAAWQLRRLQRQAAAALNVSRSEVARWMQMWREDPDDYEDYPAPDRDFRYDLASGVPQDQRTARALRKLGYEAYLAQPLPVFVYGTLRPGQHNYRLMSGAVTDAKPAEARGIGIYHGSYSFPYAAEHPDPEARTVGEVVWLSDGEEGEEARRNLDYLEGFSSDNPSNSHYERVAYDVLVDGEPVKAWTYLARGYSRDRLSESTRIVHGDWVAAERERWSLHETAAD